MKRITQLLTSIVCIALCGASAHAANKYWDINGNAAGAGGSGTPTGTWSTGAANWSTDSTGGSGTAVWTSGYTDTAIFSAGADAIGEFTVNLPSALTALAVTNEEGTVDLTGATLTTRTITITNGAMLSYVSSGAIAAGTGGATTNMTINGGTFRCMNTGVGGTFLPAAMKIVLGTGGGTLSVDGAPPPNGIQIYAGLISGTGPLVKTGQGVFRLTTTPATYSGATHIATGWIQISTTANVLPSGTDMIIDSGAMLDVQNTLRVGSLYGAGNVRLTTVTLTVGGSTSPGAFSGKLYDYSSSYYGRVTKTGAGTLELSGANTYSGTFTLSQGTCTVDSGGSLCGQYCDVAVNGGILNLNNTAQTIENLSSTASAGIINLGTGNTLLPEPAGSTTYSGTIAGAGALDYNGAYQSPLLPYTLTLSGNNSYGGGTTVDGGTLVLSGNPTGNGPTTINAGILVVSGNSSGTGATTVNAGMLSGVSGGSMANSDVTVNGGGNSVQVTDNTKQWTCKSLTYGGGTTTLDIDYRPIPALSTTLAPLKVNGNVDFSATPPAVSIDFTNPPANSSKYPLMTWTGLLSGTPPTQTTLGPQSQAALAVEGNTLFLYVTNYNEPLKWATNSQPWEIASATASNWVNAALAPVSYQEIPPALGDSVVFEDTLSGPSPITVSLDVAVNPNSVLVSNTTKEYIISGGGGIGGTGGPLSNTLLTKRGTNKLTLLNNNSLLTAPTLVQQGTLQLGDGLSLNGEVEGVINNSATLIFSNANDQTHSADIRGTGVFIKGAVGTLTLGANEGNNMSGGQTVYDGTLYLNNDANMMRGPILVSGPSARLLVTSYAAVGDNGSTGVGDITLDNGGTYENNAVVSGGATLCSVNRKIIIGANGGRIAVTGATPATDIQFRVGPFAGQTAGTGTLTYDGPGELRCYTATNTYGKLIINSGRFCAGQATTAGRPDTFGAPTVTTADAITIRNGAEMRWGGSSTNSLDVKQGITIGAGGGTIRIVPGAQLTIPGVITGNNPLTLNTQADFGILALSGANTISGGVTLYSGEIRLNNAQALGPAANAVTVGADVAGSYPTIRNMSGAAITLANNPHTWRNDFNFTGTNDLNIGTGGVTLSPVSGSVINVTNTANTFTVGGVISGSGIGLNKAGAGTLLLDAINSYDGGTTIWAGTLQLGDGTANNGNVLGNIVDNGTLVFADPTALTYSGVISGTGALTKQAAGTLTLSGGPNTQSGVTTISAGTLQLGNDDVLSDTSPVVLSSGATLDMNNFKDTIGPLSGPGNVINNTSTTLTVSGDGNPASSAVQQNYSCIYATITNGAMVKDGTHTMALRETNGLAVPITLKNGTLSAGIIPNEMLTSTALDVPSGATFQLDANNQTVASLSGAGNVNLGGGALTVNQNSDTSFSGVIQNSGLAGSSTAVGHGLRGYYYDNNDFTSLLAVRDDTNINFTDLTSYSQLPAAMTDTNRLSIRWLGQVQSTAAGDYNFTVTSDDGSRLWVNGNMVVDSWIPQSATARSGTNTLAANTRYDLVLEFFNNTGSSTCKLGWRPPGDTVITNIPTDYLFLPNPGKLVKSGSGTLTLTGAANTYSGGTEVTAGILDAQSLGTGDVKVSSGATNTLSSATAIASTANLILSGAAPSVNLNLSGGTDNIHGLSFDGGTTWQPLGLYGPIGSGNGATEDSRFQGSGFVQVTAGPVSSQTLVSSLNPANYGSSITFTSVVSGASGPPSGTVTFYDGASAIGTATLDGTGTATLAVSRLSVAGSIHSITAAYSGNSSYTPSTSSAVSQTINPAVLTGTATVAGKVYDGTTNATVSTLSIVGIISGDEPYIRAASTNAGFADRNVGTNKTVTVFVTLGGSLVGNYSSIAPFTTTNLISVRPITVTAATDTKNYDGNTTSIGVPIITTGSLGTNDTATWTETFDSPNASLPNGRTLTPVGNVSDGNGGNNYNVTRTTAAGTITPVCSATNLLLGITNNGNGTFGMGFQGTFQAQYSVKTSTNAAALMTTWVPLAGSTNIVTNPSGLWNLTVPTSGAQRFYRSVADKVCP